MLRSLFGESSNPNGDDESSSDKLFKRDDSLISESLRIFTRQMKKECWENATKLMSRDPERWRLDAVGNVVCNKLTTCEGCLCHEYDHIIPFSKGGQTNVNNCQILQTRVNRLKGNQDNDPEKLKGYSCDYSFSELELDAVELALYGDIKRPSRHCRCPSIMEHFEAWKAHKKSKKQLQAEKIPHCKNS